MNRLGTTIGLSLELLSAWFAVTALTALVSAVLPERFRRIVLLASSGTFLFYALDPEIAGFCVAFATVFHALTSTDLLPAKARVPAGAALIAGVLVPVGLSELFLERPGGELPMVLKIDAFFLVIFAKKLVSVLMEIVARKRPPSRFEIFLYLFSLPFLLGKAAVFSPSHMADREGRESRARALASGLVTLLKAAAHLTVLALLAWMPVRVLVTGELAGTLESLSWWAIYGAVLANYLLLYLFRYGTEQLSVGAARMLGYAVDDNYQRPLLARDYAAFWRRWNVHFRELVVRIFYFPTLLALHRRGWSKAATVTMACTVTFAGHGLFMLWARGILISTLDLGTWTQMIIALGIYEVFETVLVSVTLLTQNLERRRRWGRPYLWFGIALTYHLRAAMVVLILRNEMTLGDVGALFGRLFGVS